MIFGNIEGYEKFKRLCVSIFRIVVLFLILFSVIYFFIVPIKGMLVGVLDLWAGIFIIILGCGVLTMLIFWTSVVHTRVGAFMTIVGFIYWLAVPSNWIVKEWSAMQLDFVGTYVIIWMNLVVLGIVAVLGLLVILGEMIFLKIHKKSIFWGPWVSKFTEMFQHPQFSTLQKNQFKKRLIGIIISLGICIPAFLSYSDLYSPTIPIRPQKYDITYNFWAMPTINSSYSPLLQIQYNLATPYNASILAELNEHKVNLDLTFGSFDLSCIESLIEWETKCPNITYRIVLTPWAGLATLPALVKTTVETIMDYEKNGTLNQWKGLCFNIEGIPFAYMWNFTHIEDAVAMWDEIFDYIDIKSNQRLKPIDMECVSVPTLAGDMKFDGDIDLQKAYTEPAYTPDRWSVYAPMIYRAWYEGTKPYGSPMRANHPWDTSYQVYNLLFALSGSYTPNQLGIYLGITNTSCYGRDLPQLEPITWGEHTGLYNLMRDVLIAKHFGVKEVTFFLLFDAPENEYVMGGVFSSYGMTFLDIMNETVNTNPPDQFEIYYCQSDNKIGSRLQSDWLYDFSRPIGMFEMVALWLMAILAVPFFYSHKKKPE